jgi:hypothetical protein
MKMPESVGGAGNYDAVIKQLDERVAALESAFE